ncbi:telomeric repeat-binding factor 2-interacting protein 1-like isoform X5 [Haliotis rufescens]|uniref:telomeric repeat-binding factor 2-interacting protein 1-like isoform X5 n=1 Tax=Haliotis rufescens TaxID=6454 RepID=UPI001EAFCF6B|nr:telomeric repeat-binding factor 2-interacting protein 1-like isoform X5 [Haliotis rufescens]
MAAENFKFSRTLFISENGHPVTFYMRPCSERKRLKPMIEHGGGSVSSKQTKTCIKLLEPGGSVTTGGFIKSEFVLCCVKENKLVDMTKFRCVPGRVPSSDDDLSPARNIIRTKRPVKGRQKYTREEDWKIVSYLVRERRYNEVNGRKVWQDMELFEVSMHPGESMRTHYLKFILPNIKTYTNFPQHWVALLTGNTADATQVDRSKEIPKTSLVSSPGKSAQVRSPRTSAQNTQNHSDSSEVDEFDKNLLQTAMATACVDEDNRELEVFQEQSGPPKIHPENTPCSGNRKRTVTGGSTSNQETDSTDDEVSLRNSHHSASRTPCNTASDSKKMRGGNSRWRLEHCDTESQQSQEGDHNAADLLQAVEETCFHLKRFGKSLSLTLQEVLYALYINSGSEDDALHWIRFGVDTEGYPAWSQKDDEILLGTDEDNMVALEMKHGPKRLMSRRAFIEGI